MGLPFFSFHTFIWVHLLNTCYFQEMHYYSGSSLDDNINLVGIIVRQGFVFHERFAYK